MYGNTDLNRRAIIKVAQGLGELNQEVVFVGGAIVNFYIDDPAAEDIRPTKDIDLTFKITTAGKLEALRDLLNQKGFKEAHDDNVICRFKYDDLIIDVMSTREVGWAPSNRWFEPGFEKAIGVQLEEIEIKILALPYFLASKMDAFFDRGIKDLYSSTDLEDLLYIFNYTSDLVEQIVNAEPVVAQYLKNCVETILNNVRIMAVIPGHIPFDNTDERVAIIKKKMENLLK